MNISDQKWRTDRRLQVYHEVIGAILLILIVSGLGCDPRGVSDGSTVAHLSDSVLDEGALGDGLEIAVCGREITEILGRLGAVRNIVAADRDSLLVPGLMSAFDLGPGCRDETNRKHMSTPDAILSLGSTPDPGSEPFKSWLASDSLRLLEFDSESLDDIVRAIHELGRLLDREDRANIEIAQMTRAIAEVAVRRDGLSRRNVVWVVGDDPLTVVGATGLLHEMLELAGAENAFHDPAGSRFRVSVEEIIGRSPDLILVPEGVEHLVDALGPLARVFPQSLLEIPTLDPLPKIHALYALLYAGDR